MALNETRANNTEGIDITIFSRVRCTNRPLEFVRLGKLARFTASNVDSLEGLTCLAEISIRLMVNSGSLSGTTDLVASQRDRPDSARS